MKNLGQLADEGLRVWATWPPAVVAYPTMPHLIVDRNFAVIGASVSIVVRVVLCIEAGDLDDQTCCTHLNSIVAETGCGWGVGEGVTSFWLAKLKSGQDQVCPSKPDLLLSYDRVMQSVCQLYFRLHGHHSQGQLNLLTSYNHYIQ
jgi:hypothetical protein